MSGLLLSSSLALKKKEAHHAGRLHHAVALAFSRARDEQERQGEKKRGKWKICFFSSSCSRRIGKNMKNAIAFRHGNAASLSKNNLPGPRLFFALFSAKQNWGKEGRLPSSSSQRGFRWNLKLPPQDDLQTSSPLPPPPQKKTPPQLALWFNLLETASASVRAGDALSAYLWLVTESNRAVGWLQGAVGVAQLVAALPAGWAADHPRCRRDSVLKGAAALGFFPPSRSGPRSSSTGTPWSSCLSQSRCSERGRAPRRRRSSRSLRTRSRRARRRPTQRNTRCRWSLPLRDLCCLVSSSRRWETRGMPGRAGRCCWRVWRRCCRRLPWRAPLTTTRAWGGGRRRGNRLDDARGVCGVGAFAHAVGGLDDDDGDCATATAEGTPQRTRRRREAEGRGGQRRGGGGRGATSSGGSSDDDGGGSAERGQRRRHQEDRGGLASSGSRSPSCLLLLLLPPHASSERAAAAAATEASTPPLLSSSLQHQQQQQQQQPMKIKIFSPSTWPLGAVVAALITLSDLIGALASGMTLKFFSLFFLQACDLSPVAVSLVGTAAPLGVAAASVLAGSLARRHGGRLQLSLLTRAVDVGLLVLLARLPTNKGTLSGSGSNNDSGELSSSPSTTPAADDGGRDRRGRRRAPLPDGLGQRHAPARQRDADGERAEETPRQGQRAGLCPDLFLERVRRSWRGGERIDFFFFSFSTTNSKKREQQSTSLYSFSLSFLKNSRNPQLIARYGFGATFVVTAGVKVAAMLPLVPLIFLLPEEGRIRIGKWSCGGGGGGGGASSEPVPSTAEGTTTAAGTRRLTGRTTPTAAAAAARRTAGSRTDDDEGRRLLLSGAVKDSATSPSSRALRRREQEARRNKALARGAATAAGAPRRARRNKLSWLLRPTRRRRRRRAERKLKLSSSSISNSQQQCQISSSSRAPGEERLDVFPAPVINSLEKKQILSISENASLFFSLLLLRFLSSLSNFSLFLRCSHIKREGENEEE